MHFKTKHSVNKYIIVIFVLLTSCQLNDAKNKHGIAFLENRAKKLAINYSNTNDVIKIIGQPHTKGVNNKLDWIYIERVFEKGKFYKLGRNILTANNVLVLSFDKYGVLKEKYLIDKNDKNKLAFSKNSTENKLSQASFIEKFLQSLKTKMYKK